jgi:hypothetical protein
VNNALTKFKWTVSPGARNLTSFSTYHFALYAPGNTTAYFYSHNFDIVNSSTLTSTAASATLSRASTASHTAAPAQSTSQISSGQTPTTSASQNLSTQTSVANNSGLSTSIKVGLGVGIGVGVLIMLVAGFILGSRYQRNRKARSGAISPPTQYYERAELAGPQHEKLPGSESTVTEQIPPNEQRQGPVELHGNPRSELPGG